MRIDLSSLITAQSARPNAVLTPQPGTGFEANLKAVSTPQFEALSLPRGVAKAGAEPAGQGSAQGSAQAGQGYANAARLGSQIDIRI